MQRLKQSTSRRAAYVLFSALYVWLLMLQPLHKTLHTFLYYGVVVHGHATLTHIPTQRKPTTYPPHTLYRMTNSWHRFRSACFSSRWCSLTRTTNRKCARCSRSTSMCALATSCCIASISHCSSCAGEWEEGGGVWVMYKYHLVPLYVSPSLLCINCCVWTRSHLLCTPHGVQLLVTFITTPSTCC